MNKKVSDYIYSELHRNGVANKWLAEKLGIKESTISSKFKGNTFTAQELITCAIYLDIDLNKLKEKIMENYFAYGNEKIEFMSSTDSAKDKTPLYERLMAGVIHDGDSLENATTKIYILHGDKVDDNIEFFTLNNIQGKYKFQVIRDYRLYQYKHLGDFQLTTSDKTLEKIFEQDLPELTAENGVVSAIKYLINEYLDNPTML